MNLYGTNTFEGGAVLKYATNAGLNFAADSTINSLGTSYRPVILTAKDDNTTGSTIPGSTGNPTNGAYANPALYFYTPNCQVFSNLRIAYAQQALEVWAYHAGLTFYNIQILDCKNGALVNTANANFYNALFENIGTCFDQGNSSGVSVQNATFNNDQYLVSNSAGITLGITNSVLVNVTNLWDTNNFTLTGTTNGFYCSQPFGTDQITNTFYPLQTVGAGSAYLTNGCAFFNAGTTNIDPTLLTQLQLKTTYPPIVLSNITVSANTTLGPTVERNTGTPDLGFHYDPLDWLIGNLTLTNATLTLTNSVAIGMMGTTFLTQQTNSTIVSQGTPVALNRLAYYANVQEQSWNLGAGAFASGSSPSFRNLTFRLTDLSMEPGGVGTVASDSQVAVYGQLTFRDCWLRGCFFQFYQLSNLSTNAFSATFTNNVLDRSQWTPYQPYQLFAAFYNNLFHAGMVQFQAMGGSYPSWYAQNNLFDQPFDPGVSGTVVGGYNAFSAGTPEFLTGSGDKTNITLDYQTGPQGNYYYPTNGGNLSQLINAGTGTAASLGLYHYTVSTNEIPEGTNTVSIGFHYVAVDNNGNPLDTNGDGIPDYLEDSNGNGLIDSREVGWNIAGDMGLKVLITRPQNGSTIP